MLDDKGTKRCPDCGETKPLTEFYKDRSTVLGVTCYCKPCIRTRTRAYARGNPKVLDRMRRVRKTAAYRAGINRWQEANKEARNAHALVYQAIKRGDLERQPCEVCGSSKVDGHHDDYNRPLDVRWLCKAHHMMLHAGTLHEEVLT